MTEDEANGLTRKQAELAEARKRVEAYSPLRVAYGVLAMVDQNSWDKIKALGGVKLPTVGRVYTDPRNTGVRAGVEKTMIQPTVATDGMMRAAMDHAEEHLGLKSEVIKATFAGLAKTLGVEFMRRTISPPHKAWEHKMRNEGEEGIAGRLGVHMQRALIESVKLVTDSLAPIGAQVAEYDSEVANKIRGVVRVVGREFVANQEIWAREDPYLSRLKLALSGETGAKLPDDLNRHDWGAFVDGSKRVVRRSGEPMVRIINKGQARCLDLPIAEVLSEGKDLKLVLAGREDLEVGGRKYQWVDLEKAEIDGENPPLLAVSAGSEISKEVDDSTLLTRSKVMGEQALGGKGLQVDVITSGRRVVAVDVSAGHYSYDGIQVSGLLDCVVKEVFGDASVRSPEYESSNLGLGLEQEVLPALPETLDGSSEGEWRRTLGFGEVVTRVMLPEAWQQEILSATKMIGREVLGVSVQAEDEVVRLVVESLTARVMAPEHKAMLEMIKEDLLEGDEKKRKILPTLKGLLFPRPSVVFWQQAALQLMGRDETSVGICVATGSKEDRLNVGIGTKLGESLTAFGIRVSETIAGALGTNNRSSLLELVDRVVVTELPKVADSERRALVLAFRKNWKEMRMSEAMANVFAVMVALSGDKTQRSFLESTGGALAPDFAKFFVGMKSQVSSLMGKYQFDTANSGEPGFETGFANMGRNYSGRRKVSEVDVQQALSGLMETEGWKRLGYKTEGSLAVLRGERKTNLDLMKKLAKDERSEAMLMRIALRERVMKKYKQEMLTTMGIMMGLVRLSVRK